MHKLPVTWVSNRWYVAAWDNEVDRRPMGRTICGEQIVV
jgi:vanillate O-demethylase monooxygenase subunit